MWRASTFPTFGRPVISGSPLDYGPVLLLLHPLRIPPHVDTLSSGVNTRAASGSPWVYQKLSLFPCARLGFSPIPSLSSPASRHYLLPYSPRLLTTAAVKNCLTSGAWRDFTQNPPEPCAAQRTLGPVPTSPARASRRSVLAFADRPWIVKDQAHWRSPGFSCMLFSQRARGSYSTQEP